MKKAIIIFLILVLAVLAMAWIFICHPFRAGEPQVCFGKFCYRVEVARTEQEHDTGLMFRQNLDPARGMFFIFEKDGLYRFWMKNTLVPLDIVWIDSGDRIVFISKNTPLCKEDPCPGYGPLAEARYVLEINAGQADVIGVKIGDMVSIK